MGLFDFRFKGADQETPGLIWQAKEDFAGDLAILCGAEFEFHIVVLNPGDPWTVILSF